jgi:hypothetical protein
MPHPKSDCLLQRPLGVDGKLFVSTPDKPHNAPDQQPNESTKWNEHDEGDSILWVISNLCLMRGDESADQACGRSNTRTNKSTVRRARYAVRSTIGKSSIVRL